MLDLEKDPTSYGLITYIWVLGLAAFGGVVNFMRKVQKGYTRVFNVVEFFGEVFTSAFTGVITFWLCENSEISPLLTAALVGISGHMGSRALFLFERYAMRHFDSGMKISDTDKPDGDQPK